MYTDTEIFKCPGPSIAGACPEVGTRGDLREHLVRDHRLGGDEAETFAYDVPLWRA